MVSRWDPFRQIVTLRDAMDQLLEDSLARPGRMLRGVAGEAGRLLPLDVYETPEEVVVQAALPGAKPEDVEVNVTGEILTLKGRVHSEVEREEARKWNWLAQELWFGEFTRSLTLPVPVQADKAEAEFENGVLTLHLPKAESLKPKQIKIQTRQTIER